MFSQAKRTAAVKLAPQHAFYYIRVPRLFSSGFSIHFFTDQQDINDDPD